RPHARRGAGARHLAALRLAHAGLTRRARPDAADRAAVGALVRGAVGTAGEPGRQDQRPGPAEPRKRRLSPAFHAGIVTPAMGTQSRVALVTGGGRGIGAACASALAAAGARVVVAG